METNEKIINEPYGFIYITTNMVNGKRYLGQKKIDEKGDWKTYLGSGTYFNRAVTKYGKQTFDRNIVCFCYSPEELNKAEYDLSVFLDVVESQDWYNLCYGGITNVGYKHSEEDKIKMRAASKLRWENEEERKKYSEMHKKENLPAETWEKMLKSLQERGKNDEWKSKISAVMKEKFSNPENCPMFGKHHSAETRIKQSEAKKGKYSGSNNPMYGRPWWDENTPQEKIDEWKANISKRTSGENNPNYGVKCTEEKRIKIIQSNPNTKGIIHLDANGVILGDYLSKREANRLTGVNRHRLELYCIGEKQPSDGTRWMFKEEYNKIYTKQND